MASAEPQVAATGPGDAAVNEALQATSVEEQGLKVFVGNLSFSTKEEEVREIFGAHGPLTEAQIILRGSRSLGYGFVTYVSAEDAQKAVAALDKTEIGGRVINAEMAKPPPHTSAGAVAKAAAKAARHAATAQGVDGTPGEPGHLDLGEGARPKKYKRPRKKRTPANAAEGDASLATGAEANGTNGVAEPVADAALVTDDNALPAANGTTKKRRHKKNKKTQGAAAGEGAAAGGAETDTDAVAPKPTRKFKKRGPPVGELSKTTLFVANLPFSFTDDTLKSAFEPFQPVSAHVITRRYGPGEGRSKGFGFVELVNEEEQQKALEAMKGKEVEGRALQVKVAVNEIREAVTEALEHLSLTDASGQEANTAIVA